MANWQQLKLGEIATFVNGYAFKPSDWNDTGIPIIRIQNLTNDNANRNYYNGQLDEKYRVVRGDILISCSATLDVFEWTREDSYLNQHIFKVVFNKLKVNKSFFKYLIKQKINEMLAKVHGSTMKHITKSNFDNIPILLPDIKEQDKIARILDKAEEIRTKKKLANEKLDEFLKSTFIDMFDDPVTNPKNWSVYTIKEVAEKDKNAIKAGPFGSALKKEYYTDSGYKIYGQEQVISGDINYGDYYIDEKIFNKLRNCEIKENDVLIAKYAKDNNHYAKTKEELLYAFSGRLGLDLYCYWDKVLTYFLLNNDEASICNFIKKIGLSIERISYKADNKENKKELENKIKKELESYLKEALYLTLSLYPKYIYKNTNDPNQDLTLKNLFYKLNQAKGYFAEEYDEVVSAYRKSLMIKHKYCFMPIINYLDLPSDSNLSFIERDLTKCLKKGNFNLDSEKFNFNPRNFTIEDILLLDYYQQFIENTKSINKVHENAVKNYVNLNLKQYYYKTQEEFFNKKQKAVKNYFGNIVFSDSESSYDEIRIDEKNKNKSIDLYKVRFGLYNTKVPDSDITKNLQGNLNLTFKDLQKLIKFLNMSIQTNESKANIIVFPEVSVPIQWLGLLSDFSKKHNVAIICGLKHIIDTDTKVAQNYIATILPFKYGYRNDCYITFRLKKWYAPGEEKEIKKHKLNVPEDTSKIKNILFVWNNLHFAVYDCFELADIQFRSEFKSKVDFIIGCEWNRDIKYFTNITEATARDLHCYVIQVNTSQFGDSKIIAPKKSDEMTILNIKGGDDNILIGEVNIEELREFQRKETLYLEDKDKTYKTLPPNFDNKVSRLKK